MYVLFFSFHMGHQLKAKLAEKNLSHPSEPGFENSLHVHAPGPRLLL
jgi:hypothetical protein